MLRPVLERLFHLTEHRTTVRTEAIAGLTTFLTVAYIIFVQPTVLSAAGMDFGAVLVARGRRFMDTSDSGLDELATT